MQIVRISLCLSNGSNCLRACSPTVGIVMFGCKSETVLESGLMLAVRLLLDDHFLNQFIGPRRNCLVGFGKLGPMDEKSSKNNKPPTQ